MSYALTAVVGGVFLLTALIKALWPESFRAHVAQLRIVPSELLNASVVFAAAAEGAVGVALITTLRSDIVLPLTAMLLVVLTLFSVYTISSGRATDCGCYGGYFVPTVAQNVAINVGLIALTAVAWHLNVSPWLDTGVATVLVATVAVVLGVFAHVALMYASRHDRPLIDATPLKVGRGWSERWAGGYPSASRHEFIVVYLGQTCPFCKLWIPVLNAIDQNASLPPVVGVLGGSEREVGAFRATAGIRFEVRTIPRIVLNRLVSAVPSTVVVRDGRIEDRWSGPLSPSFAKRFKAAFFPE